MPRTRKPERYPPEFFEITILAQREGGFSIPANSPAEAFGLRSKLLAFFAALDTWNSEGAEPLARRLVAAQRIPAAPDGADWSWALSCASNLLAAAADLEVRVETTPEVAVVLARKSDNKFARMVRRALDAKRPSAEESLRRLKGMMEASDE